MKKSWLLMPVLAGLATSASADDFTTGDRLEAPIQIADSTGGTAKTPVNTRDRFGEPEEGAPSPIFSESNSE